MAERNTGIDGSQIKNLSIRPEDLKKTGDAPTDGQVPSFDSGTEDFAWITPGNGATDKISEGDSSVEVVDTGTGEIDFDVDGAEQLKILDGIIQPTTTNDIDLGDTTHLFKNAHIAELRIGSIGGNTYIVAPNCSYTTIQGAMDVASAGDTILVTEGTYTEAITFTQDNITLKALGSKENTIITKSNATVVEFSTKEGCVLEGFTIEITSVGGLTVHAIAGNSDTADDTPNIIKYCDITGTTTNNDFWMIHLADGTYHFIGCRFDANNTTGVNSHTAILLNTAICNLEIRDCYFDVDGAQTGASLASALYLDGVAHTVNLYNNHFDVVGSSTGDTKCIVILNGSVVDSYSNIYYSHNEDGNQVWAQITSGSTLNSYDDRILDGALLNAGTFNNYGTLPAGDKGYKAVSDGDTGGADSAGAGKQYIELTINGTTYKVLHDGTV